MVNQSDVISRSYVCPSIAGGIQCLRVKIVIAQLDPFGFPLRDAFYLLYFQEDKSDCLPATVTNVVLGGWHFWEPFQRTGAIPLDFFCWATWEIQLEPIWHLLLLAFAHLPRQLSSYPCQPVPKSAWIAWANSRRAAFLLTFAISDLASVLARGRQLLTGD